MARKPKPKPSITITTQTERSMAVSIPTELLLDMLRTQVRDVEGNLLEIPADAVISATGVDDYENMNLPNVHHIQLSWKEFE